MTKNPKPEPDDKEQSERFIETAKSLGLDENGDIFEKLLDQTSLIMASTSAKKREVSKK